MPSISSRYLHTQSRIWVITLVCMRNATQRFKCLDAVSPAVAPLWKMKVTRGSESWGWCPWKFFNPVPFPIWSLFPVKIWGHKEFQLLPQPCLPPTMPPITLWVASPQTMAKISPFLPKCFPSKEKEPNAVITQDSNVGIRITAGWKMQFLVHVRRK